MFVLKRKVLTSGASDHIRRGLGIGADYVANNEPLYMPFDGSVARIYQERTGGNWLDIKDPDGNWLQFAHLSKYLAKQGYRYRQGEIVAYTGNTGAITSGPHLHIQIKNPQGQRIDPEKYDWSKWDTPNKQKEAEPMYREYKTEREWFDDIYSRSVIVFKAEWPRQEDKDYAFAQWKSGAGEIHTVIQNQYKDELSKPDARFVPVVEQLYRKED